MTTEEMRKYFEDKGVSQQEVARFINVNPRTVRSWFAGQEPPHLFKLAIEADIFQSVKDHDGSRIKQRLVLRKNK